MLTFLSYMFKRPTMKSYHMCRSYSRAPCFSPVGIFRPRGMFDVAVVF